MQIKIKQFWHWFESNEDYFKQVADRTKVVEMLNNQILDFGLFKWEIGPGITKPYYLMISPNGNARRLLLSKRIIAAAPVMTDWEFYYCKPPKYWDFRFEMYDNYMIRQQYDASTWKYQLRKNDNRQIDIQINAPNIRRLDEDDQLIAADLVLTNILGEELKINHLGEIELVNTLPTFEGPKEKSMTSLKKDFDLLIKKVDS